MSQSPFVESLVENTTWLIAMVLFGCLVFGPPVLALGTWLVVTPLYGQLAGVTVALVTGAVTLVISMTVNERRKTI